MRIKSFVAIFLAGAILLSGCNVRKKPLVEVDMQSLATDVINQIPFKDTLVLVDEQTAKNYYEIDDKIVKTQIVYMSGTGSTAEEIAIFKATSMQTAPYLNAIVKKRIEDLKFQFENYKPEEMEKLNKTLVWQKEDTVIIVICDDPARAEQLIKSY